jgi:hypothetical protein
MKWRREKPGSYVSGRYRVYLCEGAWLWSDGSGDPHGPFNSKKEAKADIEGGPEPILTPIPGNGDLSSVLSSLRLEISHLAQRIDALAAAIERKL